MINNHRHNYSLVKGNTMTTQLDALKQMTVVVADTGDIEAMKLYKPQDATTNPSLILSASALPQYASLIDDAVAYAKARDNGGVYVNGILMDAETYYKQVGGGSGVLSNYVYSATNIRLREASLSYKFGKPLFGNTIKDLTISVNARNLWMIYNKAPFDPQLTSSVGTYYQGIDYFLMPSLRSFGLNVRFAL